MGPKPNPNTHTSRAPGTATRSAARRNWWATDQLVPSQCSTREGPGKFWLTAQTLSGDEAAAPVISSPGRPGNAARCQPRPVSCQATGRSVPPDWKPSNAHPLAGPVAVTALKYGALCPATLSAIRQPPTAGRTATAAAA
jgi:hypothetical protein